ncbi:MAG: hypothetical protein K8H88_10040 [Sandaracinaceae bacterium]|nr:hypothetical protein [Sandaracinaceae bacterium]
MRAFRLSLSLIASLVWLVGCGGGPTLEDGGPDSGSMGVDGGGADGAILDAGPDGGPPFDGGTDAGFEMPVFRNPVATPDDELARQALVLLGAGTTNSCAECHDITRSGIQYWRELTQTSLATCLTDLEVTTQASALEMVTCLRAMPPSGPYQGSFLGAITIAAYLPWFQYVFQLAYGATWETEYQAFTDAVGMSPSTSGPPLTMGEWDIVIEWFLRGTPLVDRYLGPDPPPTECVQSISPALRAHVADMALTGWASVNRENNLLMFGCAGAANTRACLSMYPDVATTTFGASWNAVPGTQMRLLFTTDYESSYWTRSSADGRFVAHGSQTSGDRARIIDLQRGLAIPANAQYDPGFFPDNSGFMLQPSGKACETSVLTTGSPTRIAFTEPTCTTSNSVGLYQHHGAALGGGDYWTVYGSFVSDDGGHGATLNDPVANFDAAETARFTPMFNTGSGFTQRARISVSIPYEGDTIISPSARLIVSRVANVEGRQLGFAVRRVDATPDGSGGYTINAPQIARYCFNGGKPAISYDERWLVVHHYIGDEDAVDLGFTGPTDPAFATYRTRRAANVYLVDLLSGQQTRLTNSQPGQYALFPHFRSDGWIYWIVRTASTGVSPEHVVASDAALVIGG